MIPGLPDKSLVKLISVFQTFPEIEEAVLYGSRVKGNYKNSSDIDISLKGNNINLALISKIEQAIDEQLIPQIVDITIYKNITNQELKSHIDRLGKVIYTRE